MEVQNYSVADILRENYTESVGENGKTKAQCNYCTACYSKNTSEQHFHLASCTEFGKTNMLQQQYLREKVPKSVIAKSEKRKQSYTEWQKTRVTPATNVIDLASPSPKKSSLAAFLDVMTNEEAEVINRKVAAWVYKHNVSWNAVDNPEFKDILVSLRPAYAKTKYNISRRHLAGKLLDESYLATKQSVDTYLDECACTQVMVDSWTNTKSD